MRSRVFSITLILLFVGCCFSKSYANNQRYSIEQVPNVQLLDSTQFVTDPHLYLSSIEKEEINRQLLSFRHRFGIDAVVVILPQIDERYTIEEFAIELLRHWGLGSRDENNGLLLLIDMGRREIRFEVGYGLEGVLPDALLAQIIDQELVPLFRNQEEGQGIVQGLNAIDKVLQGEAYHTSQPRRSRQKDLDWTPFIAGYLILMSIATFIITQRLRSIYQDHSRSAAIRIYEINETSVIFPLFLFIFLPGAIFLYIVSQRFRKKLLPILEICPSCRGNQFGQVALADQALFLSSGEQVENSIGSRSYKLWRCPDCGLLEKKGEDRDPQFKRCPHCHYKTARKVSKTRSSGQIVEVFECIHCKHRHTQTRRDTDQDALLLATLLGSMPRGGGSRGGFGSGGFGGGTGGGGGATGRF